MDLYFANKGTGKTTILTMIARKELKKIRKGKSKFDYVVSNAQIKGVQYIENIRSILRIAMLQKCLILIDEGSIVYNNNDTKDNQMNLHEKQFYKLERHLLSKVVIVSQAYDDINITLRRLYDNMYLLLKLPFFTAMRPIRKYIGIDETTHQIVDMYEFKSFFSWKWIFRPIYFKYFDTHWLPKDITIYNPLVLEKIPDNVIKKARIIRRHTNQAISFEK